MRLDFLQIVAECMNGHNITCPVTGEVPPGAEVLGTMPEHLRGVQKLATGLAKQGPHVARQARLVQELISLSLLDHFDDALQKRGKKVALDAIGIAKDWQIFVAPIRSKTDTVN